MQTSKELTKQYRNGTLPDGDYYFECGDHIHKGRFFNPTPDIMEAAAYFHLPKPTKALITFEGRFVGDLKTVTILSPIPDYHDFMDLVAFAKGEPSSVPQDATHSESIKQVTK